MILQYKLSPKHVEQYGFNFLVCSGWFGKYADNFNDKFKTRLENKFTYYDKIEISLTDSDIDSITKNAIEYKEFTM